MFTQLVWLVPLFPLLGFVINALGFGKWSKTSASIIGIGSVLLSFVSVIFLFMEYSGSGQAQTIKLFDWIVAGDLRIGFSFLVDALTLNMLLIITGIGLLIHIYSSGYMHHDEGFGKFFAYLNLFMFSMLILVLGSNFVMMFIGWEGVGLCSYLLIGYWFKNREYTAAANKAFIMNRIGDLGFLLGIFLIYLHFGSVEYQDVFSSASFFSAGDAAIVAITLLLFVGAMGKSAQIPLYTWLPDAMAGPTPVSALIHAATMVTAGIYMIVRSNVLFSLAPVTLEIILIIGVATAMISAIIALTQNDIKKVLAYSTVSQLGYMFAALGVQAYSTAMFHVTTHAFFKALLFLGAGSVIHAMSGEQNMRFMGGLKKKLPLTYFTMLIGTLAITGFPLLSGFFSKDEILLSVMSHNRIMFILLVITSVLSATYMLRLLFMTFFGQFRGTHEQEHHLHESPPVMTYPLIILAFLSVTGGILGLPHITGVHHVLSDFLQPIFINNTRILPHTPELIAEVAVWILSIATLAVVGHFTYRAYALAETDKHPDISKKSVWYRLSYNKFYVDEIYEKGIVRPVLAISSVLHRWFDQFFIDGIVNGAGQVALLLASILRTVQTGNIGLYVIIMVAGIALTLFIVVFKFLSI
ncbi:NADH dehydrogenase subunit L [Bacteroidota bacterium]|nr:NADH dehydrogenase subunit L [Bacteroidota bacterium]